VTAIVQCEPGASGPLQPFVTLKSVPATPLTPPISTVAPDFFGFVTLIFLGPLCLPTFTVPKFRDEGLIFSLTGTGVGVGVAVAVAVMVAVGVEVAVAVDVAVAVVVAVAVAVAVRVAVAVSVAVAV
jgi:hypothetical protein